MVVGVAIFLACTTLARHRRWKDWLISRMRKSRRLVGTKRVERGSDQLAVMVFSYGGCLFGLILMGLGIASMT